MKIVRVILNGKSADKPGVRAAIGAVRSLGHEVEVRVTWEAGDVERLTLEALDEARQGRIATIVAGGGDGTVNQVFGTAFGAGVPAGCSFGILPLGTANDFAHSAGVPTKDLTAALRLSVETVAVPIDLGMLDGKPFANMATGGFGSRITAETDPKLKRRLGGAAYALTALSRLKDLSASAGVFRGDGFEWEGPFIAMAIGNGRQAGGGQQLCPGAVLNDGMLDLTIMPDLPSDHRPETLAHLLRSGRQGARQLLQTASSTWFEFEGADGLHVNLDGEPILSTRFRVECRPGAVSIHVGEGAAIAVG